MKKTRILASTTAVMFCGSTVAYAVIPDQTLIIGNKGYNLANLSSLPSTSDLNKEIANNLTSMYYKDSNGIKDLYTGKNLTEDQLVKKNGTSFTYYPTGLTSIIYAASVNAVSGVYEYVPQSSQQEAYAIIDYQLKSVYGNSKMITGRITNLTGVPGAEYYSLGNSAPTKMSDSSTALLTTTSTIPVIIYSSDMTTIASGSIAYPSPGNSGSYNATVSMSNIVNPIADIDARTRVLGNIANGGYLDCDDQYIYYVGDGNKIYKKNAAGTINQVVCEDSAEYLSVYGGWIYYTRFTKDKDWGKIFKVKIDGTQRQKISDNKASYLNVKGDKVYYINGSDNNRIHVLDASGSSKALTTNEASYLKLGGANDAYLYYSNISDRNRLYQYDLQFQTTVPVDNNSIRAAKYINASNDSSNIYYTGEDGKLYRDGIAVSVKIKPKTELIDDQLDSINVVGRSMIYYRSLKDGKKLYSIGTNGGQGVKITDDAVDAIFVYPNDVEDNSLDDIYYLKSGKLYMISHTAIDGTGKAKGVAVAKPTITDKIQNLTTIPLRYVDDKDAGKDVADVNMLKYLPDKVPAMLASGQVVQIPVSWDIDKGKAAGKNGLYTFTGTLVGYGKTITATVSMASSGLVDGDVIAENAKGKSDSVLIPKDKISKLSKGDIVKVYNESAPTKALKSATVTDNTVDFSILGMDFGTVPGNLLITVTKVGKSESRPLIVPFGPERPDAPVDGEYDLSNVKLSYVVSGSTETTTIDQIQLNNLKKNQEYIVVNNDSVDITNANNWTDLSKVTWITDSTDSTKGSTVLGPISMDSKYLSANGLKILVRTKADNTVNPAVPYSTSNTLFINPRVSAPNALVFDEGLGTITGTTTRMEYSTDAGYSWTTAKQNITNVDFQNPVTPVRVRLKATTKALPSLETMQVKLTTSPNTTPPYKKAIDTTPNILTTNGIISIDPNSGNKLTLYSSVPVDWKVYETNGNNTTKATIAADLIADKNGKIAVLTGWENGTVKVVATTKDKTMSGYTNINITNQKSITVSNTTELLNALNDPNDYNIIKLKALQTYDLTEQDLISAAANTGVTNLSIIGQENTATINYKATGAGPRQLANVQGGQILNLTNLTVRSAPGSVPFTANDSVVRVSGGTAVLNGVIFSGINNDSNGTTTPAGSGVVLNSGSMAIQNSKFTNSNAVQYGVQVNGGTALVQGNSFDQNASANGSFQGGYYQTNAASSAVKGNIFNSYNNSGDFAIKIDGANNVTTVGGVQSDWNFIQECKIGIWDKNAGIVLQAAYLKNNSFKNSATTSNSVYTNGNTAANSTTTITSPLTGAVTKASPATITGTAVDPDGNTILNVKVRIKNQSGLYLNSINGIFTSMQPVDLAATVNLATGDWTLTPGASVPFPEGIYTIEALVNDGRDGAVTSSIFTIDSTVPSADATAPITESFAASNPNIYDAGDTFTIKFSEPVQVNPVINDINSGILNPMIGTGTGQTVTPQSTVTIGGVSYADTFTIQLGTGSTVPTSGGSITITAADVIDSAGNIAAGDVIFTIKDITANAPMISTLTFGQGTVGNSTKVASASNVSAVSYMYLKKPTGVFIAPPIAGDTKASLLAAGYIPLTLNTNITSAGVGDQIAVAALDANDKVVAFTKHSLISPEIAFAAPTIGTLNMDLGSVAGARKITAAVHPGVAQFKYRLQSGAYTIPLIGANGPAGFSPLTLNTDIVMTPGQHLVVVGLDTNGKIAAVTDQTITPVIWSVVLSDTGSSTGINVGDSITITFDGDTNVPAITAANINSYLKLTNGHSFGTGLQDSDITWQSDLKTLVIQYNTSTTGASITAGDTVTVQAAAGITAPAGASGPSTASKVVTGGF